MPWLLCGVGILFCASGVFLIYKNAFEEGHSLRWPIIIMIMGVVLIGWGTAIYVKLI
jgi:uncharacterized membrane protein YczE